MKSKLFITALLLGSSITLLTSCSNDTQYDGGGNNNGNTENDNPWWLTNDPETLTPGLDGIHPDDIPWWWTNDPETLTPGLDGIHPDDIPWWWINDPETLTPGLDGIHPDDIPWWWINDPETLTPGLEGIHPDDIPWWWINDPETLTPGLEQSSNIVSEKGSFIYYSTGGLSYKMSEILWLYEVVDHKVTITNKYSDYRDTNNDGILDDLDDNSANLAFVSSMTYTLTEEVTYIDMEGNQVTEVVNTLEFKPDTLYAFLGDELVFTLGNVDYSNGTTSVEYHINTDLLDIVSLSANLYDLNKNYLYGESGLDYNYGLNSASINHVLTVTNYYYIEFVVEVEHEDGTSDTINAWYKFMA